MPIYLPETTVSTIESLTPRQIVVELDKYVVGQHQAKRAVAIALRNRMRRHTQTNARQTGSNNIRHARGFGNDDRQRSRPKSARQFFRSIRPLRGKFPRSANARHMNDQRA